MYQSRIRGKGRGRETFESRRDPSVSLKLGQLSGKEGGVVVAWALDYAVHLSPFLLVDLLGKKGRRGGGGRRVQVVCKGQQSAKGIGAD